MLIDLLVDLTLGFAWRPLPFTLAQNAAILGFSLWLAGRVLATRSDVLSFHGVARAAPSSGLVANDDDEPRADCELRRRLAALIEAERIHLDPDLTFTTFVQRMNAPERALR